MIYLHTGFRLPTSNVSLVITVKQKTKYRFQVIMLFIALHSTKIYINKGFTFCEDLLLHSISVSGPYFMYIFPIPYGTKYILTLITNTKTYHWTQS